MTLTQKEVKKVFLGTHQVRPEPEGQTIARYKFEGNLNDSSGNGNTASIWNGSASYQTVGGQQCFNCNNANTIETPLTVADVFNHAFTLSMWLTLKTNTAITRLCGSGYNNGGDIHIQVEPYNTFNGLQVVQYYGSGNNFERIAFNKSFSINTWYNIVMTYSGSGKLLCYINGQSVSAYTSFNGDFLSDRGTHNFVLGRCSDDTATSQRMGGLLDEIIIADKQRTATEILNYYNDTKATYGY